MHKTWPMLRIAAAAVLIAFGWQYAAVRLNYQGSWTALFQVGKQWPLPPELKSESSGLPRDLESYDGVFYHLAAHDPWFSRGFFRFADNSSLRWRRILVPALAHAAALGRDEWIDRCYVAVNLFFIFAGAWWLSRYCVASGAGAACGLAFLLVPSVLVSIDRLTIDTALAALTIGFVVYASEEKYGRSLALVALCPLARETGLSIVAGRAWQHLRGRQWLKLLLTFVAALPCAIWFLFVSRNTPVDSTPWLSFPFAGILRRTLAPVQYPIITLWVALAAVFDYLALIGIWIALGFVALFALQRRFGLLESCIYTFALAVPWLGKADIWEGAYNFGRTLSPLIILLGLLAIRDRNRWLLLPLACVLPRILLQFEAQFRSMIRHF